MPRPDGLASSSDAARAHADDEASRDPAVRGDGAYAQSLAGVVTRARASARVAHMGMMSWRFVH